MTLIMVLVIYIGSLCLLSFYNFFKTGYFWRNNYSPLNRKWFFLYSLIIEGVVLILLPNIRYLFNEPYVNTTLGTIVFVFILVICNTITQFIGVKRLFDIGITDPKWYLAVNFLLLGSALFPSTIKNIIVNAINMVILLMPRQKIKNNKSN